MKIEHVAVYVKDLEGAKCFFETYFNASSSEKYHNKQTGLQTYFLSFENNTRLEIMTRPNLRNINDSSFYITGYTHLAFSVGDKKQVNSLTQRLSNDGYKTISGPRITGDGYYESLVLGYENIEIEITI